MAQLKILITNNVVESFPLDDICVIGRGEGSDLPLIDATVSREHARIERRGNAWLVTDLGSANGTWVNRARVASATLREGDVVGIGNRVLVFTHEEPATAPQVTVDFRAGELSPEATAAVIAARDVLVLYPSAEEVIEGSYDVLRQMLEGGPLALEETEALLTAIREALSNAWRHGNRTRREAAVRLRYVANADKVVCTVEDEGAGFDYREALERGRTLDAIDAARERYMTGGMGGLGIMLMLRSVDLVEYNASGNRVVLTKCRGDFFRDETVYGALGLFDSSALSADTTIQRAAPYTGPSHPTVHLDPAVDGESEGEGDDEERVPEGA